MPTLTVSVKPPKNACKAAFSVSKAVFQFAVLSTKISTFGRTAVNAGLARKMSVSSLTGSNTGQPVSGAASSAAVDNARMVLFMVGLPSEAPSSAVPGELPDLGALRHHGSRPGQRIAHRDGEFPDVVFRTKRGDRAESVRRRRH